MATLIGWHWTVEPYWMDHPALVWLQGCQNKPTTGAFHQLFWILCRLLQMLVGQFWAWYWINKMEIAAYFLDATRYSKTFWPPCVTLLLCTVLFASLLSMLTKFYCFSWNLPQDVLVFYTLVICKVMFDSNMILHFQSCFPFCPYLLY